MKLLLIEYFNKQYIFVVLYNYIYIINCFFNMIYFLIIYDFLIKKLEYKYYQNILYCL